MSHAVGLRTPTLLLGAFLSAAYALGGTAPQEPAEKGKVDEKAIQALVEQLGHDSFETREAADKPQSRMPRATAAHDGSSSGRQAMSAAAR